MVELWFRGDRGGQRLAAVPPGDGARAEGFGVRSFGGVFLVLGARPVRKRFVRPLLLWCGLLYGA